MSRVRAAGLVRSASQLRPPRQPPAREAEGGCGVVGLACSVRLPGRVLLPSLFQMRNRGNGKGGGIAAAGLDPVFFGVDSEFLASHYLLAVAYLDTAARSEVEAEHLALLDVDHVHEIPVSDSFTEVPPPSVTCYFVRVPAELRGAFMYEHGIDFDDRASAEEELVYQTSYRLNDALYVDGKERAFVLSHGKDLLVLKLVGYGDDVVRTYGLSELQAQVWIGHHRYPTKGRVWHPGGAHPFIGMHDALVHNGDFANYASMCTYLSQYDRYPQFQTDTEVAALTFDLLHRAHGYPLEYVIEALAPTTERDLELLPADRRDIYRVLQTAHIHGSPDGPWFFLIAQSVPSMDAHRLIGVTDTSMLRPQVFAVQKGEESIGLVASEKQAIDAVLETLATEDDRFWSRADRYWSARGGSHTDGGAFVFTIRRQTSGSASLSCTDKFGNEVQVDHTRRPTRLRELKARTHGSSVIFEDLPPLELAERATEKVASASYEELAVFLDSLARSAEGDDDRMRALQVITSLIDRRYPTGSLRRSVISSMLDESLSDVVETIRKEPSLGFQSAEAALGSNEELDPAALMMIDARQFTPEGPDSASRAIVRLVERGARRLLVAHARGHRFLGCGLGPGSAGVAIDVYGSSGDYLASGIDGASITAHGSAQDQVAQITKSGRLVVYGDVGQAFMYAAKGGEVYVFGSAAGRPLISAVGTIKVVINGTCLDYLAESFMAGDPLTKGGFALLNGVYLDDDGRFREMREPYPGGNLLSLASGGAVYVRDPHGTLTDDVLNGGEYVDLTARDWELILPRLEENERLFGITLSDLLTVNGTRRPPADVYRKVQPVAHHALSPEEAWVLKANDRRTA